MDSRSGSSSDTDSDSIASCYGHIAANPFRIVYRDNELVWGKGIDGEGTGEIGGRLQERDVICVTQSSASNRSFTILSLSQGSTESPITPPEIHEMHVTNLPQSFLAKYLLQRPPGHLRLPPEDIYVVISTESGAGNADTYFESIIKPVLTMVGLDGESYQVIKTESHESIRQFASGDLEAKAVEEIRQTVLLLSGDGGVVDIVNGLFGTGPKSSSYIRPTICLFPFGTANALFHSIHRSLSQPPSLSDITTALRTLLTGTPDRLPHVRTTFSPSSRLLSNEGRTASPIPSSTLFGSIVISYGLHATLVADSDTAEWRKHGAARFSMVANNLLSLPDGNGMPHAYQAKVTLRKCAASTEGVIIIPTQVYEEVIPREEHGYILMTLVSNLEKKFCISPASKCLDGKLWIVHFGPKSGEEIMYIMGQAYQGGGHVLNGEGHGAIGYEEIEGARVEFLEPGDEEGRWRRVCVDGLIVRVEEGGWMDVKKVEEGREAVDILVM